MFEELDKNRGYIDEVENKQKTVADNSGATFGFSIITDFASLPTVDVFTLAFVTDGRKTGEPSTGGTGVPAYYDPISNKWLTFSNDQEVTI